LLLAQVCSEVIQMPLTGCHEQISLCSVSRSVTGDFFKPREEIDGIKGHPNVDWCGKLRAHASHTFGGWPHPLAVLTLDYENVSDACFTEMKGDAGAHDTTADDHHFCRFSHRISQPRILVVESIHKHRRACN